MKIIYNYIIQQLLAVFVLVGLLSVTACDAEIIRTDACDCPEEQLAEVAVRLDSDNRNTSIDTL